MARKLSPLLSIVLNSLSLMELQQSFFVFAKKSSNETGKRANDLGLLSVGPPTLNFMPPYPNLWASLGSGSLPRLW